MTHFEIKGKIVPYTRMTQRSKWVDPRAQKYLASKGHIQLQLKNQMAHRRLDPFLDRTPLAVTLIFYRPAMHKCDLDNLVKAVLDAAQDVLFKDDRWVDSIIARRYDETDEHSATLDISML